MIYTSNMINPSPTIVGKAGAAITDVRGKAVKFNSSGKLVLCSTANEEFIGVALVTNDENIASGQDIDVQIKDIGVAVAGGAIAAGDPLATDANGKLVKTTTSGAFVIGHALADAASGALVRFAYAKHHLA